MLKKSTAFNIIADERGMALIWVLILFLLGSLLVVPLLGLAATGLKTGQVFEKKTGEQFAADAGIEEGIWRIKYDYWGGELQQPEYDKYNFSANWSYQTGPVNGITANVTIRNVWIPVGAGGQEIETPSNLDEIDKAFKTNKLMVLGTSQDTSSYDINIIFTPDNGDNLTVKSVGVWLPRGFNYNDGSGSLEQLDLGHPAYSQPVKSGHAGGQAVVWTFGQSVPLALFPTTRDDVPGITFSYTSDEPGAKPAAIAWLSTKDSFLENGSIAGILPVTWDIDTRIYKITSRAGNTEIEAYSAKIELRRMTGAIAGQYVAVGNSLMTGGYIRNTLITESSTSISDIPADAEVVAAYLYWSGWLAELTPGGAWSFGFSGSNFRGHYDNGGDDARYLTLKNSIDLSACKPGAVQVSGKYWREGWGLSEDDTLLYQLSNDGGSTWSDSYTDTEFQGNIGNTPQYFSYTIPDDYLTDNFTFRFYLKGFSDWGKYANIADFYISDRLFTADTSVTFKINGQPVYLDEQDNPQKGNQPLTAGSAQAFRNPWNYNPGNFEGYAGYSYACRRDVTKLVQAYSNEGANGNRTGNGSYTVGGVQATPGHNLSYAGWSLIIIYASPETAGHYLYLYDRFVFHPGNGANPDFDGNGQDGMDITGFVVPEQIQGETIAAKLTAFVGEGDGWFQGDYLKFNVPKPNSALSNPESPEYNVWNGKSYPRSSNDGVDIDTFTITWSSGLLEPKDTTAHLDLPSQEAYNLIYLILSVRSETTMGGFLSYLMRGSH